MGRHTLLRSALHPWITVPRWLIAVMISTACGHAEMPLVSWASPLASAPASAVASSVERNVGASPSPSPSPSAAASSVQPSVEVRCATGMQPVGGGTLRLRRTRTLVEVLPFCLESAEVSVGRYRKCVEQGVCKPKCVADGTCKKLPHRTEWPDPLEAHRASKYCNGESPGRDEHPMNCVRFEDAVAYCRAHDARLPTEAEWEWAAIGDDSSRHFPWGKNPPTDEPCWAKPRPRGSTCAVGTMPRDVTPDGIFDLAGNVSEWVTSMNGGRGVRGGSFIDVDDGYIRAALWGIPGAATSSETYGFRCAAGRLRQVVGAAHADHVTAFR